MLLYIFYIMAEVGDLDTSLRGYFSLFHIRNDRHGNLLGKLTGPKTIMI